MFPLNAHLIGVDVETTGTFPYDRVVQIGILKLPADGGAPREWKTLVDPQMKIPADATAVHGITDAMVKDAPTFKHLAPVLAHGFKGADFLGFNIDFDLQMLQREFDRCGVPSNINGRLVDVMRVYHKYHKRKLADAVRLYLGEDLPDAHDALADIKATVRVFEAQLSAHSDLPQSVELLHREFFETVPPGCLDVDGKIAWRDGEAVWTFGTHPGLPVRDTPHGYLRWMLRKDFNDTVKHVCREALKNRFPVQEKEGS